MGARFPSAVALCKSSPVQAHPPLVLAASDGPNLFWHFSAVGALAALMAVKEVIVTVSHAHGRDGGVGGCGYAALNADGDAP